jgi:amino acid adenylation domain-containing protein
MRNEREELLSLLLEQEGLGTAGPVIPRRSSTGDARLSLAQRRLWVLEQVEGASAAYNVGVCIRLHGALRPRELEAALTEIVRRHEPLRTTFAERDGEAVQVVHAPRPVTLERIDAEARESFGLRRFNLTNDLPVRAALCTGADDDWTLILVFHHAAVDRWSFDVLPRELLALLRYEPLPELPIRYADYAEWQRELAENDDARRGAAYWKQRLHGVPELLNLPTDRPRRPVRSVAGAEETFRVDAATAAALARIGAAQGATLFMTLLAAFDVLLSRWSGDADLCIGCPVANRDAETAPLIGFFVNTIVLRADLSGDPEFNDLLRRLRDHWIADLDHQSTPFESVVELACPSRTLGQNPLFQVMFQLEPSASFALGTDTVSIEGERLPLPVSIFDLTLELQERPDGLAGRLEYRTDLFEAETARRLCRQYERLLRAIVAAPRTRISRLALADEAPAAVPAGIPRDQPTLVELFDRVAAERPDATALIAGGQTMSYGELAGRANAVAHRLRGRTNGVPVAVGLPRSPELVVALLGVLKAGLSYVPLDPDHPTERLAYILNDAQARLLITVPELAARFPDNVPRLVCDETTAPSAPAVFLTSALPAYVMYTSGSTGQPKGVVAPHGATVNRLRWMWSAFPFAPGEKGCQKTTITFVDSVWEIFGPLLAGVPSLIVDSAAASDPQRLARAIEQARVTRLVVVPSLLAALLDIGEASSLLASLRLVVSSGEALPVKLVARFRATLPGCRLLNLYGSTEVAADVTWHEVTAADEADDAVIPAGRPIDGVSIRILDAELRPVAPGVPGKLYVAGAGNALGYWRRPALTAERWIADPHGPPGTRLFRTGDIGRERYDGLLELRGRADEQVKINGVRIEPAEIQTALAAYPGMRESIVAAHRNARGEAVLVAYVAGDALDAGALRAYLRTRLPGPMIPSAFCVVGALPRTPSGKIDASALPDTMPADAPPRRVLTMAEEVVAAIWCDVLSTPAVAPAARFFELGGHSLGAIRAVAKINDAFGCALPVSLLFDASLEEIARAASAGSPGSAMPAGIAAHQGSRAPASAVQRRAWFLQRLEPSATVDNLVLACRLRGSLDSSALEHAIVGVVRRHEALRTRLVEIDGELAPVVDDAAAFAVQRANIAWGKADAWIAKEARRPFDLGRELPTRATIATIAEDDHLLLIALHHAAFDGWSGTIFTRELNRLYRDGNASLPPLPIRYADFAQWQQELGGSDAMRQQIEAWRRELVGAPATLDVPVDHPRPAVPRWDVARAPVVLDPALVARLRELARQNSTTLFMTLLSAFGVLLARYAGRDDVIVGTPVAGRTRPELHDLIGCFADTIPVRFDLTGDPPFRDVVRSTRRRLVETFERQVPFEAIVDAVNPPRGVRTPLFQHLFVLRDVRPWIPDLPGIAAERIDTGSSATRFDLTMVLDEFDGDVRGHLEYAAGLFEPVTVRRMIAAFETLLRAVVEQPGAPLLTIDSTSAAERQELLALAASAEGGADDDRVDVMIARRQSDGIAVEAGDVRLTYAQIERQANRMAHYLLARRIGPGHRVALCMERSPELIVSILAVLKCGAVYVPIDPANPPARRQWIAGDADARLVLESIDADALAACDDAPLTLGPAPFAALIYTSGSTGQPKGTLVTHRGLCDLAASLGAHLALRPGHRVLQVSALGFDVTAGNIVSTLAAGATLCLCRREDLLPGPPLLRTLRATRATHAMFTSSMLVPMLPEDLPDLRVVVAGGEVCPPDVVRAWAAGRRFLNAYGPTEATVVCTIEEYRGEVLTIGRPIAGARIYVLDDRCRLTPFGVEGDLYIAGSGLAAGYVGRPAETAQRFVADPFGAAGERMFRSGDRARVRFDGRLELRGRSDRQLKIRGYRIEPGEIESVIAAQDGVARALVASRPDPNGEAMLVAWIVARGAIDLAAVRAACRAVLPSPMVPSDFVRINAVPLTQNGKIAWNALPAPVPAATVTPPPDMTPDERIVAEVWRDVLRRAQVGIDDNFFDAGGHSLLLVRVHTALEQRYVRAIALVDLFRFPTVRTLAASLVAAVPVSATADEPRAVQEPIAIIGMACRYPGAPDIDAFWALLASGGDAVTRFSEEELIVAGADPELVRRPDYVRANGVVADADRFDAAFFGFAPREAEVLDPQQRVFLECAWHALEDAGYATGRAAGAIGVFAGSGMNTYLRGNVFPDGLPPEAAAAYQAVIGNDKDFLPTLVSYKLDLTGPAVAVQTACSTSLVAVDLACQSLRAGRCRMALAGGVSIVFPQTSGYLYELGMILSPDGTCRAFDAQARGTVRGSGAGAVVLKPLSAALADGDRVLAVIRGSASNNDGSAKVGFTAPSVEGQAAVIAAALKNAGAESSTIEYIEAHGTGTELGDPVEIAALSQVFDRKRPSRCLVGSVKTNIGHADAAAGVAGLIKAVLALDREMIPQTVHFTTPNPHIDFDGSAFAVSAALTPWPRRDRPRRAGVSSFGIGGTNVHVVIEEAPPPSPRLTRVNEVHVFPLSARTLEALRTMIGALRAGLETAPELDPGDVAFTLQCGRMPFEHRFAIEASTIGEAVAKLAAGEAARDGIAGAWVNGATVDWTSLHKARARRRVALPGYPFERARHWCDPRAQREAKRLDPEAWFYLPAWTQSPLPPSSGLDGSWLLFADHGGVAEQLARELTARGGRVEQVPARTEPRTLFETLRRETRFPRRIVHLGCLDATGTVDDDLDRGLHHLIDIAAALASTTEPLRLDVITAGVHDVTGTEELRPGVAAALGAVKVIPLELPNVRARAIDIVPLRLEQLVAELTSDAPEPVVAFRGPHRWTPRYEPVPLLQPGLERLRRGGVYLITGGGAAGLAIARHLAHEFAAKLVLVSRKGRDGERVRRELEAAGAEVLVRAADVSDLAAMEQVVSEARARFGAIEGVIHTAGVADYAGVMAARTRAQTDAVMAAKVAGTLVLESVLAAEARFFVLFSTLGSILHHTKFGQVAYAAANEFLDASAPSMRARGGPFTIAINWDDWAGAGMSEEAAKRRGLDGVDPSTALTATEGVAAFRRALQSPYARLAVSVRPLQELLRRDAGALVEVLHAARPAEHLPHAEASEDLATPSEVLLAEIWRNCLGVAAVRAEDDFLDLGGHSLLATQVMSEVRKRFGVTMPMMTIFDHSTVRALAARIDLLRVGAAATEFEL